jgi:hypothetical protein
MTSYDASRIELYEKMDKPNLAALPQIRHEYTSWKIAKVSMDYHIQVKQHYYSVPFNLVREEVQVKIGEKIIDIFHNNKKVTSHAVNSIPFRYSTIPAHMPPNHLAYKSHSASSFISWASSVGAETKEQVETLLATPQYKELSYRSILGLKRLEKTYGKERLEEACKEANQLKRKGQRAIKALIEEKLLTNPERKNTAPQAPLIHSNIRGSDYYH